MALNVTTALYPGYAMPVFQGTNPFAKLKKDVDRLDMAQKALYVGGVLPPLRRLGSLPDSIEDNNWVRAGLLTTMAAANFPGDATQLGLAYKEFKDIFANGIKGAPDVIKNMPKKEYQRMFGFFKGTFLEDWAKKYDWLKKADTTAFSGKFGEKVMNLFKIKVNPETDFGTVKGVFSQADEISAVKFNGNAVQNITGRSLLRISKISVLTTALLEIPALIKSITKTKGSILDKVKAFGSQLMKSGSYVGLSTALIAIGGAILFPYGVIAELAGMAIGSAIALMASNTINNKIDNLFNDKDKDKEKQIFPHNIFALKST